MWSGFSSEIETRSCRPSGGLVAVVACGAASHLRLKRLLCGASAGVNLGRMWSGFSSEIETEGHSRVFEVACGAASHLRLKLVSNHTPIPGPRQSHVERLLI